MRTLNRLLYRAASAAYAFCVAVSLLGCGGSNGEATIGASVDNLLGDPNAYYGSRLTVSGTVGDIISPTVFTIQGSDADRHLLVVSLDSIAPAAERTKTDPVAENDLVQVSGQVREFAAGDLESEYGIRVPEGAGDFDGQPMIVARNASATLSSVVVTPRPGSASPPPGEARLFTELSAIAGEDADELVGEAVHLRNVAISSNVEGRSFWAVSGEDSLFIALVSGALGGEELEDGGSWEITGILRELPSSSVLNTDWDLPADLVRQLESTSVYLHGIRATPNE